MTPEPGPNTAAHARMVMPGAPDSPGASAIGRPRTLLLVDDEASVLASLKRLFRRDGYQILTAASGAEALAVLAETAVDVIISDQRMPGMMGVDFLRRAKALHPSTIRMTLSGFTDLQSIIDAVNEGAVYKFLTKPWDDERLREHVAQAFTQKELADDNLRLQRELARANAEQATLNGRLAQMLDRQRALSELMQISAGGLHDLINQLPAAVIGLDPDGMLAYLNQRAIKLMPDALASLGDMPGPTLSDVLAALREAPAHADLGGQVVVVNQRRCLAWLNAMPRANFDRGDVLMLIPVSADNAADNAANNAADDAGDTPCARPC